MDLNNMLINVVSGLFSYGPFLLSFLIAFLLVIISIVMSGVALKWKSHYKLTAIFSSIALGSTLSVALSGRVIYSDEFFSANNSLLAAASADAGSSWVSRFASLIILSISISEILLWCLRKRKMGDVQFRLWIALIIYYSAIIPISGVFGNFRDVGVRFLYCPIVFTAVALLVDSDFRLTLRALRWVLFVPLFFGLVSMWFAPALVMETGYKSLIPGFNVRLAGFTLHANMLGFIALSALLIETSKYVVNRPNLLILSVAASNVVLAQSKTMWIAAVFIFSAVRLYFYWQELIRNRDSQKAMAVASAVIFLAAAASLIAFYRADSISSYMAADRTGLATFTGRTLIWNISLEEFLKSPIFGYGPSIWDPLYRFEKGLPAVGQAHNQFMQVLGQAGGLGVLAMLFYVYKLTRLGFESSVVTYGLSLSLIALVFVRSFSETPLHMNYIVGLDVFIHLLVFSLVLAAHETFSLKKDKKDKSDIFSRGAAMEHIS